MRQIGHLALDIHVHTGAGGQCKEATYAGIGADVPAHILHTGTEKWGGAADVMPDWASE